MPVRQLLAVGLWVCVTTSATAIVWAGTSTVAADLTDRPAPVIAHRDVVSALQPGAPADQTVPGITTPKATGPATNVPPASAGSALTGPDAPMPPQPETPASGGATAAPPPMAPTTQPVAPPTIPPQARPTATYATAGGVVTVACNGSFFIELVSATPTNGYAVRVATPGPYYVEVHFVRGGQDDPIWAFCLGQPIRANGAPASGQPPGPP